MFTKPVKYKKYVNVPSNKPSIELKASNNSNPTEFGEKYSKHYDKVEKTIQETGGYKQTSISIMNKQYQKLFSHGDIVGQIYTNKSKLKKDNKSNNHVVYGKIKYKYVIEAIPYPGDHNTPRDKQISITCDSSIIHYTIDRHDIRICVDVNEVFSGFDSTNNKEYYTSFANDPIKFRYSIPYATDLEKKHHKLIRDHYEAVTSKESIWKVIFSNTLKPIVTSVITAGLITTLFGNANEGDLRIEAWWKSAKERVYPNKEE